MGISKDYFKNIFSKLNIKKSSNGASLTINLERFGKKIDITQDVLDAQVWSDIQKYMPMRTGNLIEQTNMLNQATRGEIYLYPPNSDYGHYMYEGIKYEDPEYGVGAFYSDDYGYWSRPGVAKVPSNEPLFYSNPIAEAHWAEVAYKNHGKQWLQVSKRAVK